MMIYTYYYYGKLPAVVGLPFNQNGNKISHVNENYCSCVLTMILCDVWSNYD